MLGLDVYNGSTTQLTTFRNISTVSFPLLLSASGTGFSREDLVVVAPDGTVAFKSNSLSSSTVRSNAIAKVDELLAPPPSAPAINVQQTAVDFGTIDAGQTGQQTIAITNTGTAPLEITGIESDVSGLTFEPSMFTLSPDSSKTVTIAFPSSTAGTFSGNIAISSNDPDRAVHTVSVSVIVQAQAPSANPKADFNGDKEVNITDFLLFVQAFGSTNSKFDINGDGAVDITDFLFFVESFGKKVSG